MNKLPIILVSALAAACLLSGCRAEKRAESAVSTVSETGNTEPSLAENAVTAPAEPFFFEDTYRPDSRAEEVETGRVVRLTELFGQNASDSTVTFCRDGTFTDGLRGSDGDYRAQGSEVKATCRPDEAMPIDVTEWNADGAPETFCVTYDLAGKGYRVFFQRTTNAE